MIRKSLALFQKSVVKEICNTSAKNFQLNKMDTPGRSTSYMSIFTVDERAKRIRQAMEIDIPVLEDLDKELVTQKNQQ